MLTIIGHVPFDVKYSVYDTLLPYVTTSRNLRIVIAQDLSPSIHISEIAAKAYQRSSVEKIHSVGTIINVETSYFTRLKMCHLMTTFRCPTDIETLSLGDTFSVV